MIFYGEIRTPIVDTVSRFIASCARTWSFFDLPRLGPCNDAAAATIAWVHSLVGWLLLLLREEDLQLRQQQQPCDGRLPRCHPRWKRPPKATLCRKFSFRPWPFLPVLCLPIHDDFSHGSVRNKSTSPDGTDLCHGSLQFTSVGLWQVLEPLLVIGVLYGLCNVSYLPVCWTGMELFRRRSFFGLHTMGTLEPFAWQGQNLAGGEQSTASSGYSYPTLGLFSIKRSSTILQPHHFGHGWSLPAGLQYGKGQQHHSAKLTIKRCQEIGQFHLFLSKRQSFVSDFANGLFYWPLRRIHGQAFYHGKMFLKPISYPLVSRGVAAGWYHTLQSQTQQGHMFVDLYWEPSINAGYLMRKYFSCLQAVEAM